jgi:hypothetical protein
MLYGCVSVGIDNPSAAPHPTDAMGLVSDSFFLPAYWEDYYGLIEHMCCYTDTVVVCRMPVGAGLSTYLQGFVEHTHPYLVKNKISAAYFQDPPLATTASVWVIDDSDAWTDEALSCLIQYTFDHRIHVILGSHSDLKKRLLSAIDNKERRVPFRFLDPKSFNEEDSRLLFDRWAVAHDPVVIWEPRYFQKTQGWPGLLIAVLQEERQKLRQSLQHVSLEGEGSFLAKRRPWILLFGMVLIGVIVSVVLLQPSKKIPLLKEEDSVTIDHSIGNSLRPIDNVTEELPLPESPVLEETSRDEISVFLSAEGGDTEMADILEEILLPAYPAKEPRSSFASWMDHMWGHSLLKTVLEESRNGPIFIGEPLE